MSSSRSSMTSSAEAAPLISVVLATYNRAHLIRRAVDSVIAQSLGDWELIVVDDASIDNTNAVLASYKDRRIRYFRHELNKGSGGARNTGIVAARGRFLAFIDSDDEWISHRLEKQYAVFVTTDLPNVGVVNCGLRQFRGKRWADLRPNVRGQAFERVLAFGGGVVAGTGSLMVRHEPGRPLALFDERLRYGGDWEYLLQVTYTYQLDFCPEALVVVHDSAGDARITRTEKRTRVLQVLLAKYPVELAKNNRVHAKILRMLGTRQLMEGDPASARRTLLKGVLTDKRRVSLWWWFLGSFAASLGMLIGGRRGLRIASHALRAPDYARFAARRVFRSARVGDVRSC